MDDLLQEFIAETRETLEALSGEIVAWEASPDDRARLDAIFRFVHTVKGSCGFLDLPRLARLSHAAEDVLAAVRAGERAPDTALVNAVLAVVDRIGEITEAIASGESLGDSGEDLLIAALDGRAAIVSLPETETPAVTAPGPRAAARSVRLGVDLLDRMMSGMSDMVLARNELARAIRETGADPRAEIALGRLSLAVGDLRETVTRTRMQKVEVLFSALPRMVRDTAATLGKSVSLQIEGSDVELDREMVEVMRDPLVHIIRNAVDHGIEAPDERRRSGKRPAGRLTVAARQSGNQIIIDVRDDGRGVDTARLVAKLAAQTGQDEAVLRALPERAKLDLIFHPGLSSKDQATAISGRGVGMDVVRANVEQIGGRVELASTPGKGMTISIHVPLTLSIMPTIIVGVGAQRFAIPRQAVAEIVSAQSEAVRVDLVGDARVATLRGRRLPMLDLGDLLGIGGEERRVLVIVAARDGDYALAVEVVHDAEELVVKPATPAVMAAGLYAGHTLPDSGLPMLLLDASGIATAANLQFERVALGEEAAEAIAEAHGQALLFVDLDGTRRAVALEAVERVEMVHAEAIRLSAGRLRMTADGVLLPLVARGALAEREEVPVLRLSDGLSTIGYAIEAALEIVSLPATLTPSNAPGPVAGVVLIGDEPVELLDPFWLFAEGEHAASGDAPLCLLHPDEGGWMRTFLKPVLEASGYRVTFAPGDAAADVALAIDGTGAPAGAPLVTLCERPGDAGDGRVYRYDRAALIAAVADRVRERRAA